MVLIDSLLFISALYLVIGLLYSIYFYVAGAKKLDAGVEGAPWHFKVIIFPGVILFWGALLVKQIRNS